VNAPVLVTAFLKINCTELMKLCIYCDSRMNM